MTDEPARPRQRPVPLSAREREFATLYAAGRTLKEIAYERGATLENVEQTLRNAKLKYRKTGLDVHTRADVREALRAERLFPVDGAGAD